MIIFCSNNFLKTCDETKFQSFLEEFVKKFFGCVHYCYIICSEFIKVAKNGQKDKLRYDCSLGNCCDASPSHKRTEKCLSKVKQARTIALNTKHNFQINYNFARSLN